MHTAGRDNNGIGRGVKCGLEVLMAESKKNETAERSNTGQPEAEKNRAVTPVTKPIGETRDNLRQRAEWFSRRTGKS